MSIIRPNKYIANLLPYKITSQDPWIVDDKKDLNKLDWNEGNYIPKIVKKDIKKYSGLDHIFSWYPDYTAFDLHKALADFHSTSVNNVLSFPGSDEALDCACRCFLEPYDEVIIPIPSYDNFKVFAESAGAKVIQYEVLKPYEFSLNDFILFAEKKNPKIIYLVSPNNPCGYIIKPRDVEKICKAFPETLIICDQAYEEFAPYSNCIDLISSVNNLIISRTFSKAFSIAGMRLGYVFSSHEILKILSKIRNGKNISMMSQIIGMSIIKNIRHYDDWLNNVTNLREYLYKELKNLGIVVYKSHGNFLLFEINSSKKFIGSLKKNKFYIRDKISSTNGGIRITITDKNSINLFLDLLNKYIKDKGNKFYF